MATLLALPQLPAFVLTYLPWFISGLIVVSGLLVYGLPDVLRMHFGRIWAIGGVCFRDAIRRRVLWITPLAMLGIIVTAGLQRPVDEQDAIRLTIKFCFLTSAVVVTIIAIITACTNLPREVESRVIYTIVTKPVTRLEIVIGKIVGFARVSAAILLIMGLFSLTYLHAQAFFLQRNITRSLQSESLEPSRRDWLAHYQDQGLLFSQKTTQAMSMAQYARLPNREDDFWMAGSIQDAIIPFNIETKDFGSKINPDAPPGVSGVALALHIPFESLPVPPGAAATKPMIAAQILDSTGHNVIIPQTLLSTTNAFELKDPTGVALTLIPIDPEKAMQLATLQHFCVQLIGMSGVHLYNVRPDGVTILVPDSPAVRTLQPAALPLLRGTNGRYGQQLRGPEHTVQPVAVFHFEEPGGGRARSGNVPFELKVQIEGAGTDDIGAATTVEIRARSGNKISPPVLVYPENRRTAFFQLPGEFLGDGTFDLIVQNKTSGHVVGVEPTVFSLVSSREYFGLNVFKGMFVLWLFTILTSTAAFCCSTFLSWPIAVVLTVLIMLGRLGVSNLDLGTGLGAQIANEFFPSSSAPATVVNQSVEALTRTLVMISSVLPDIEPFGVTDQLERGATITLAQLAGPLEMLALFGLPLLTGAYVFFRNREVAP